MKNFIICILFVSVLTAQKRVMIEGEAEYKFSDNETLIEAKSLCYNMALRNAVESYQIFVSSMTDVQNLQLRNDIIQTLSTGYLDDLTVVDEKIDKVNNSIYYKLKAYIQPEPFKKALKREVARRTSIIKPAPIKSGKYLSIINIIEKGSQIKVVYKKNGRTWEYTKSLWATDGYEARRQHSSDYIFITFYDEDGIPLDGDKKTVEAINANEIRSTTFYKPSGTKSYEVSVTK